MLILFAIVVLLLLGISILYTQHPLFGKIPTGERLKRIENSPNYRQVYISQLYSVHCL